MTRRARPKRSRRDRVRDAQSPEEMRKRAEAEGLVFIEYEITSEPMEEPSFSRVPQTVKEEMARLYELVYSDPQQAIPGLEALVETYPDMPMLYNHLANAYMAAGQAAKSEAVIRENYRRNPDYLFARLNYAELCLRDGEYDKIKEIFNDTYELSMLYPGRKQFHVSEVVGFMGVMGLYFLKTGRREQAEMYVDLLEQVAPDHPLTNQLQLELLRSALSGRLSHRQGRRRRRRGSSGPGE